MMNEARVSVVASFPPGFFLENIAGGSQTGFYITCMNRRELYWVASPCQETQQPSPPILVETFEEHQRPMGILRTPHNRNVFYIVTSPLGAPSDCKSQLRILDNSDSAISISTKKIMDFPSDARHLNGFCALSESVFIAADSFASCIWRIDLKTSSSSNPTAKAKVWYSHHTMAGKLNFSDIQPGTNGLKYSVKTGYAYYTSTQQRLFCRVKVDPYSLDAVGEAEVLAEGWQWDDLILDDRDASPPTAYLTTHRDNAIVKISLELGDAPVQKQDAKIVVLGPKCPDCIGPTSGVWLDGRVGQSALFLTDGGIKNPPRDGTLRMAKVIRVDFDDH